MFSHFPKCSLIDLLMGNGYDRLILCKTIIARELTCCKIFVRHLALRKLWSTILFLEKKGGIPYLTHGLQSVSQVGGVNSFSKIIKLEWLSTDNLSSPLFA